MLIPTKGIVIYKDPDNNSNYVESGRFVERNGDYKLEGLTPFSLDQLSSISAITEKKKGLYLEGLIPKNLISFNQSAFTPSLVWHVKASRRKILFNNEKLTKEYDIPDVVFYSLGNSLSIYFIKKEDAKEITESTVLYMTHFLNVYNNSTVCIGNGFKLGNKSMSVNDFIKKVEFNFFEGSTFNHAHRNDIDITKIWTQDKGVHPENQWKKSDKKIGSII